MEFLFKIINFTIFTGLLVYFLKKPLINFFKIRRNLISEKIFNAKQVYELAVQEESNWNNRMKNLDAEINLLVRELIHEGEMEKRNIIEIAKKHAEQLKKGAQLFLRYEMEHSIMDIKKFIAENAINMAVQKLRKELTQKKQIQIMEKIVAQIN